MIKFLISFFIIFYIISCKQIQNQEISSKINDSVKKIEKIIEKKQNEENFKNKEREDLISLLVLKKYFYYTNQIKEFSNLDY